MPLIVAVIANLAPGGTRQVLIGIFFALGVTLLVAWILRIRYHPVMSLVLPIFDAFIFAALLVNVRRVLGVDIWSTNGGVMMLIGSMSLLVLFGVFRLRFDSMAVSTIMANAVFLWTAVNTPLMDRAPTTIAIGMLNAIAACGFFFTATARRAVRAETAEITLRRFLPRNVIDGAYDDPLGLIQSPRETIATVLVSDVRNFTSWSDNKAPTEVLDFLDRQ